MIFRKLPVNGGSLVAGMPPWMPKLRLVASLAPEENGSLAAVTFVGLLLLAVSDVCCCEFAGDFCGKSCCTKKVKRQLRKVVSWGMWVVRFLSESDSKKV